MEDGEEQEEKEEEEEEVVVVVEEVLRPRGGQPPLRYRIRHPTKV